MSPELLPTMQADYAQRRRVLIAIAITVILGPAAFLLNRDSSDEPVTAASLPPGVTVARPDDTDETADETAAATTSPLGTAPVGYLGGSTVAVDEAPTRIAIPLEQPAVKGVASFSSEITATTECHGKYTQGIPFNATLTVTNLDNSRKVQCFTSIAGPEPATDIVLSVDAFVQIADLTDSPVPIEITWAVP